MVGGIGHGNWPVGDRDEKTCCCGQSGQRAFVSFVSVVATLNFPDVVASPGFKCVFVHVRRRFHSVAILVTEGCIQNSTEQRVLY